MCGIELHVKIIIHAGQKQEDHDRTGDDVCQMSCLLNGTGSRIVVNTIYNIYVRLRAS